MFFFGRYGHGFRCFLLLDTHKKRKGIPTVRVDQASPDTTTSWQIPFPAVRLARLRWPKKAFALESLRNRFYSFGTRRLDGSGTKAKDSELMYSREESNLHRWFRRPPSSPIGRQEHLELRCKGKVRISHDKIPARLARILRYWIMS